MKRYLLVILVIVNAACEREARLTSIDVTPSVDAFVGNSIVMNVSHSPAEAMVPGYHYKTSDQFVASINSEGVIVCNHVGTCTIMIATADTRFSTTCIVNVKPTGELFDEPVVKFNTMKTIIKLQETGKKILHETETVLIYQGGKSPVKQIVYQFDENQKLISSAVELETSVSSNLDSFMISHDEKGSSWIVP